MYVFKYCILQSLFSPKVNISRVDTTPSGSTVDNLGIRNCTQSPDTLPLRTPYDQQFIYLYFSKGKAFFDDYISLLSIKSKDCMHPDNVRLRNIFSIISRNGLHMRI